jgi:hypothetical protein
MAVGNRIITGQFAVNYTQSNYLTKVMNTMTKISRQMYGEDNPATSKFTDTDKIRRNTPIWDAGFDIMVGYGEKYKESYESIIILDCCQITGCTQQLDYNGEPVVEMYSFIARDMKFSQVSTIEQPAKSIDTKENTIEIEDDKKESKARLLENLSIIDSTIYINSSNKQAKIEIEENTNLESAHLFIRGVDDKVFTLGKEGKITNKSIVFNLTMEEKRTISKYASVYGNRVQSELRYGLNVRDKIETNYKTIIFKVVQ